MSKLNVILYFIIFIILGSILSCSDKKIEEPKTIIDYVYWQKETLIKLTTNGDIYNIEVVYGHSKSIYMPDGKEIFYIDKIGLEDVNVTQIQYYKSKETNFVAAYLFTQESHANLSCLECHVGNNVDDPLPMLNDNPNDLCSFCHGADQLGISHPVNEEVSCVSCHNIHQSEVPEELLCTSCHINY